MQQATAKAVLAKQADLTAHYGSKLFHNAECTGLAGERVALVLFYACLTYIVQLILSEKK